MAKSRPFPRVEGVVNYFGDPGNTSYNVSTGQESVVVTSNGRSTDHPFHLYRDHMSGSLINGNTQKGSYAVNCPSRFYDGLYSHAFPEEPTGGAMLARLYANTNPTRAEMLLPVFLLELRELPAMLYHMGQTLLGLKYNQLYYLSRPKQLAAQNLAWQFGWLPLISDLKKLTQLEQVTAKRMLELDKLYSGSGLQRRMNLHHGQLSDKQTADVGRGYVQAKLVPVDREATIEVWGTVKWKPTPVPKGHPSRRPTDQQLRYDILGLSAKHITANIWNALPWSWLVDWFTNFGDLIEATSGRTVATPSRPNIMTHKVCRRTHALDKVQINVDPQLVEVSAGMALNEEKIREQPGGLSISAFFPILSGRQLSILASLAVLRAQRPTGLNL